MSTDKANAADANKALVLAGSKGVFIDRDSSRHPVGAMPEIQLPDSELCRAFARWLDQQT